MTVETEIKEIKNRIWQEVTRLLVKPSVEHLKSNINSVFKSHINPRLETMYQLNIEPEIEGELKYRLARGDRPIIYADHQGHGDGFPLAATVVYLRNLAKKEEVDFPGIVLPLAKSMYTGNQGWPLKVLTEQFTPVLAEKGLEVFPYTRKKDIKYGLKQNPYELLKPARDIQHGYGIGYFPEASVQGGRHKNWLGFIFGGETHGIIEPDDKDGFVSFYDLLEKFGNVQGDIFFLPVAFEGTYRFFGADIPIPTLELFRGLFKDTTNPAQATIMRPIGKERLIQEFSEDWKDNGAALSNFLMEEVAEGLPDRSRGIHKNKIALKLAA